MKFRQEKKNTEKKNTEKKKKNPKKKKKKPKKKKKTQQRVFLQLPACQAEEWILKHALNPRATGKKGGVGSERKKERTNEKRQTNKNAIQPLMRLRRFLQTTKTRRNLRRLR